MAGHIAARSAPANGSRFWVLMFLQFLATQAVAEPMSWSAINALPQPPTGEVIPYGDHPEQFGELMLPSTKDWGEGPFPIVIWIHGGCWYAEFDYRYTRPFARAVADLGFAVWSIEYRRIGQAGGGWPGTFEDAIAATEFLNQLVQLYPIDPDRVVAAGHSAGGQLALWLAARSAFATDHPLHSSEAMEIRKVIAMAPAADLYLMAEEETCGDSARKLMGGAPQEFPDRYRWASPTRLHPGTGDLFVIDGEWDRTWSQISQSYVAKARQAGVVVNRQLIPGAGHFDLIAPMGPSWDAFRQLLGDAKPAPSHFPGAGLGSNEFPCSGATHQRIPR